MAPTRTQRGHTASQPYPAPVSSHKRPHSASAASKQRTRSPIGVEAACDLQNKRAAKRQCDDKTGLASRAAINKRRQHLEKKARDSALQAAQAAEAKRVADQAAAERRAQVAKAAQERAARAKKREAVKAAQAGTSQTKSKAASALPRKTRSSASHAGKSSSRRQALVPLAPSLAATASAQPQSQQPQGPLPAPAVNVAAPTPSADAEEELRRPAGPVDGRFATHDDMSWNTINRARQAAARGNFEEARTWVSSVTYVVDKYRDPRLCRTVAAVAILSSFSEGHTSALDALKRAAELESDRLQPRLLWARLKSAVAEELVSQATEEDFAPKYRGAARHLDQLVDVLKQALAEVTDFMHRPGVLNSIDRIEKRRDELLYLSRCYSFCPTVAGELPSAAMITI